MWVCGCGLGVGATMSSTAPGMRGWGGGDVGVWGGLDEVLVVSLVGVGMSGEGGTEII